MFRRLDTASVAAGVAVAGAFVLATTADAQERTHWKMQSAFASNLPHAGAAGKRLEAAAATLGASRAWVFATVTLPLVLPGILNGLLLSFARSLGEFGATITFVSNIPGETQTIPLAIYGYTQVPGGDAMALRLCVISIVLSLGALVASEWLLRAARRRIHG